MLMAISVASMKINISAISELKWNGMGEFKSDEHYVFYCEQESLRRNEGNSQQKSPKYSTWMQSQK